MYLQSVFFLVFLIFSVDFGESGRFSQCRIGKTWQESELSLSKFKYNNPRENEIVRTKFYLKNEQMFIKVETFEGDIYFGKLFGLIKFLSLDT